ncbi:hypothetical protein AVEN_21948-1 [Araneus ventricosus]|uniref:Uncharacterized protein n=1 Tax=Araneus ventricosus TaxID=182803 RepID=A0A4Y2V3G0_ARAVE|nr:hypothetical protein AVEN_117018-1 [Araneus ventricosus]GBO18587.1 hypothetical protein AVEN_139412-1 [Araneus ventricosus]GBO20156.1 hypothetical protein AVEN_102385-1 [Araneus ventricosus]GBO20160.1 hypothetical protein AVEN_21948-1 [Araneus ventricosus]
MVILVKCEVVCTVRSASGIAIHKNLVTVLKMQAQILCRKNIPLRFLSGGTHTLSGLDKRRKPAGVFFPKLSRILPPKGAVPPFPAWLKKFEPTVIQNPMTIRKCFVIVIEKYLGKEFKEIRTD